MKFRALYMLGKCSTNEPHSSPKVLFLRARDTRDHQQASEANGQLQLEILSPSNLQQHFDLSASSSRDERQRSVQGSSFTKSLLLDS